MGPVRTSPAKEALVGGQERKQSHPALGILNAAGEGGGVARDTVLTDVHFPLPDNYLEVPLDGLIFVLFFSEDFTICRNIR